MANEYGYDASGSVVGGLGQLLQMKRENDQDKDQKASVPFLNQALAHYLGGNQLPNFAALAPFIHATQGLSEGEANTARAGSLNAESSRLSQLLPGQLQEQSLNNQFNEQSMPQRLNNLGAQGNEMIANARGTNARADIEERQAPYAGEEALGKVLGQWGQNQETGARTSLYNQQADLAQPEFGLKQKQSDYSMSPDNPENKLKQSEAGLSQARARNFDAETQMYQPQQQQQDPRMKAFADALAQHMNNTGKPQTQQKPQIDPQLLQSLQGDPMQLMKYIAPYLPLGAKL